MSNDVIKSTIKNLVDKYSKHPLTNKLLVPALSIPEMETAIGELMKQYAAGNKFSPAFSNIFRTFDIMAHLSPDGSRTPKVIIVNAKPYSDLSLNDGMALSFPNDTNPQSRPLAGIEFAKARLASGAVTVPKPELDNLCMQQVLLLNIALTQPEMGNDHFDLWAPVTTEIIRQVDLINPKAIWLFIGDATQPFSLVVNKEATKFYVPDFELGWEHNGVLKKINDVLLKNNKSTIAW